MKKIGLAALMVTQVLSAANVGIIPTPQKVVVSDGTVQVYKKFECTADCDKGKLAAGLKILDQALQENKNAGRDGTIHLSLVRQATPFTDSDLKDLTPDQLAEAYSLSITKDKIQINATTEKGLFYGLMSLTQLVRIADDGTLPQVTINDYPDMTWRAVSDDFSRGQVSTMKNFQEILTFLAEYKQNIYMPYMEDVIQLDKYPDIGVGRGALSKTEIKQLQAMATGYFIDVIPIFQTLGHYENILTDPKYMKYAEFPGAASLNSISRDTDKFLFNMLDEVIPLFDSPYFHIGCDESWDVGLGATKEKVAEKGIAQVHADHYNKVYHKVTGAGKKVMMYGDIILTEPEIMEMIPKDIIIVDWHYWPTDHYSSAEKFKTAGYQFLVSPGIHNWRQFIPNFTNAWTNISNINYEGYLQGALGSVNSNWGDFGGPNLRELNYMGYAFGAESSWNPSGMDGTTIRERFLKQYFGCDGPAVESLILSLNEIVNNMDIKKFWRNPFLPDDTNPAALIFKSSQLIQHGENVQALIDKLRQKQLRHAEMLDYYEYGARAAVLTGRKIQLKRRLDFYVENNYTDRIDAGQQAEFIKECDWLVAELGALETLYRDLWLRTNRPDNLEYLLTLLKKQAGYISLARAGLVNGTYNINQEIPSQWIAAAAYNDSTDTPPAFLRKTINVSDPKQLTAARLQVVGNDAAKVYVNGKELGLVAATKSLSLIVELRRVGWWDIAKLLKPGPNTIAVEVQAYKPDRPSCANIYLELVDAGGRQIVASDSTWEAATSAGKGWQSGKDKTGVWQPALTFNDYPWQISVPLFDQGMPSQLEF